MKLLEAIQRSEAEGAAVQNNIAVHSNEEEGGGYKIFSEQNEMEPIDVWTLEEVEAVMPTLLPDYDECHWQPATRVAASDYCFTIIIEEESNK